MASNPENLEVASTMNRGTLSLCRMNDVQLLVARMAALLWLVDVVKTY
jgi:hypothetical protein